MLNRKQTAFASSRIVFSLDSNFASVSPPPLCIYIMASESEESHRKRRRSPTPSSPSSSYHGGSDSEHEESSKRRRTDLYVEVCRDFKRSGCKRSEMDCKFAHPHSAVTIDGDKVMSCADSLRNKCFRGRTCRYYHPPPRIQESLRKAIGVEDSKVEEVCKEFISGRCLRSAQNCRYAHHLQIDHCAVVCQDFIRGRCERKTCRYSHVLVPGISQVCQDFMHGKCERSSCRFSHVVIPEIPEVCQDFLRGRCERTTCRYTHVLIPEKSQVHMEHYGKPIGLPNSPPRSGKDQEILKVCRDFLKKMCKRESCKYAHPDLGTKVVDNQVEVCRDFRHGICNRTVCRFYHPSAAKRTK